jgi:hypothetical protein
MAWRGREAGLSVEENLRDVNEFVDAQLEIHARVGRRATGYSFQSPLRNRTNARAGSRARGSEISDIRPKAAIGTTRPAANAIRFLSFPVEPRKRRTATS